MFSYMSYAKYLTFPAEKRDMISRAQDMHLPQQFISELDKVPDQIYTSSEELLNAYDLYK